MNEILIIFSFVALLTGGTYFDDQSISVSLGIFDVFTEFKLPKIINQPLENTKKPYYELEGSMIMRVYNSESNLVAYIYADRVTASGEDIPSYLSQHWTVEETISKDGKNYNVLTTTYQRTTTDEMETLGHFVLNKPDTFLSLPDLKIKNPQINIVPGDVVIYDITVLQPVL